MHTQPDDTAAPSVLLTGATGFVGRFLLSQLLDESDATIYCLVRARSERTAVLRIRDTLTCWDLWRPGYERRIVGLPGDLRQPHLGLPRDAYGTVVQRVSSIFHCGASVNHLESYDAAKAANVAATSELLKIAAQGRSRGFHHISTLGIFARNESAGTRSVSEETPIEQERHRQSSGYAASKWVAESMVLKAQKQGLPCNVYRLGLLFADSKQGRFDEQQHVYRLLQSCLSSGYGIENFHYESDPVPVDYAVRAIVALATRQEAEGNIFHITSLAQVEAGLFERCNQILSAPLKLLPLYDWICEMKRLHRAGRTLPIVPLIEFAFSMGRKEFAAHVHEEESRRVHVECQLTARALEQHGIAPPRFSLDLIAACLKGVLKADQERGSLRLKGTGTG
jgi:thioester reductase-like protein